MGLQQQIEQVLGREIPVRYLDDLLDMRGNDRKEALTLLERNSRVIDLRDVLEGRARPERPLCFVITECRGGFLVQLREGLAKT